MMPRRLALTTAALIAATIAITACQSTEKAANTTQSAVPPQLTPSPPTIDASFIDTVGKGGITEVKFGQVALSQATRVDVRAFAAQMVSDHTAANQELIALAQAKQMTPPSAMDLNHQAAYDQLSNIAGSEFDRVYIEGRVRDRAAVVAAFQDEIANGTDADVKAFAKRRLPTIQHQLETAQEFAARF